MRSSPPPLRRFECNGVFLPVSSRLCGVRLLPVSSGTGVPVGAEVVYQVPVPTGVARNPGNVNWGLLVSTGQLAVDITSTSSLSTWLRRYAV